MKLKRTFIVSRDADDYEASTHLLQRLREDDRKVITGEMIAEAIEEGTPVDVNENRDDDDQRVNIVFRHEWLMTTFEVVIGPESGIVETAYEVES